MQGDAGQVGMGTLGVLAAGLVAMTAATQVVVEPGGDSALQASAEELARHFLQVGAEATDRFTPYLEVVQVYGRILGQGERLDALNLTVRAPASAGGVDLGTVVLRLADGARDRWLAFGAAPGFRLTAVRDPDGSLGGANPRLTEGDLASLDVDLREGAADFALPVRHKFSVELVPEKGAPARLGLQTPSTFGPDRVFTLR